MNKNQRIVIYGIGKIFDQYKDIIPWSCVVHVVDKSENKLGTEIKNFKVERPEVIVNEDDYIIIVFSNNFFNEIRDYLVGELFVNVDQILSYTALINDDNYCSEELRVYLQNEYNGIILPDDFEIRYNSEELNEYENLIWIIPHRKKIETDFVNIKNKLLSGRKEIMFLFCHSIVYIFMQENVISKIDLEMFVVSHKKYNCIKERNYKIIAVGNDKNFQYDYEDDKGKNIAVYNPYINECTAIYWVWKNTRQEYVGISHYRRFFYNNLIKQQPNVLSTEQIEKIINDGYEIILPAMKTLKITMLDNISYAIGKDLCFDVYEKLKKQIEIVVPDYLDEFIKVANGNCLYRCNMFVTSRLIFEKYCEWLFSFILDVSDKVDYSNKTTRQKRVVGYFAELMLTVWINKHNFRIKELPITDI